MLEFARTRMGARFFDADVPRLVAAVERLALAVERLVNAVDGSAGSEPEQSPTDRASADEA